MTVIRQSDQTTFSAASSILAAPSLVGETLAGQAKVGWSQQFALDNGSLTGDSWTVKLDGTAPRPIPNKYLATVDGTGTVADQLASQLTSAGYSVTHTAGSNLLSVTAANGNLVTRDTMLQGVHQVRAGSGRPHQ